VFGGWPIDEQRSERSYDAPDTTIGGVYWYVGGVYWYVGGGVVVGAEAETVVGGEVATVVGGEVGGESSLSAPVDRSALSAAVCGAVVALVSAVSARVKREPRCS